MSWIRLEQSVWTHRKGYALADALSLDNEMLAVAYVARLWSWVADNAPDGLLAGVPARVVARAAGWAGSPSTFVNALVECGWLDRDGDEHRIHDWEQYAGKLIERRRSETERVRRWREQERAAKAKVTRTDPALYALPSPHVPNVRNEPHVPNETNSTNEVSGEAPGEPTRAGEQTEAAAAAAAPPRKTPTRRQSLSKSFETELGPLIEAFRLAGLPSPPLKDKDEIAAAVELLELGSPEHIAECWRQIAAGEYGGKLDPIKVGFCWLNAGNLFFNWLARKEGNHVDPTRRVNGTAGAGRGHQDCAAEPSPFAKYART